MFSSRTTRARRARIAVALLGTAASLALPSFATAGGITAVVEPAGGGEGTGGHYGASIPVWTTLTCRPTNPEIKKCRFSPTAHDGTASGSDYDLLEYRHTLEPGESIRKDWWHVLPLADTSVEGHETLTVDVSTEGVIPERPFIPGLPPKPEEVVERTVSAPAQFTIWNDDFYTSQGPTAPTKKKTTCWTCR